MPDAAKSYTVQASRMTAVHSRTWVSRIREAHARTWSASHARGSCAHLECLACARLMRAFGVSRMREARARTWVSRMREAHARTWGASHARGSVARQASAHARGVFVRLRGSRCARLGRARQTSAHARSVFVRLRESHARGSVALARRVRMREECLCACASRVREAGARATRAPDECACVRLRALEASRLREDHLNASHDSDDESCRGHVAWPIVGVRANQADERHARQL
jgi:hypothetical protein